MSNIVYLGNQLFSIEPVYPDSSSYYVYDEENQFVGMYNNLLRTVYCSSKAKDLYFKNALYFVMFFVQHGYKYYYSEI